MKVIKYILTIGLLIFCFNAQAQYYEDVVYLHNGSIIRGYVMEQSKETIKIKIEGGSILVYSLSEVDRIVKEEKKVKLKREEKEYQIKEKGYYHTLTAGFLQGVGEFGSFAFGGSMHYTFGYQYKSTLSTGLGVGSDSYFYSDIRSLIPIYLETRGYFMKKPFSPYYCVQAGYGIALLNDAWNMTEAEGGLYIHPKIGLRFPSRANVTFITEIGYSHQQATYVFDDWQGRYQDDITFHRLSMRLGLLF